jgi:phage-related protein
MAEALKPLVWLEGEIKTPPFTREGRVEAGTLLLRLQRGESLGMPHSRPMPSIGKGCHELRVRDGGHNWRIFYRLEPDCILILDVMQKKTQKTPAPVIAACQRRLADYYLAARGGGKASG